MNASADVQALFDLSGRVAVVTGASSGIGRAMAGALSDAGASVVLVARRDEELEAAAAEIRERGCEAAAVTGDLSIREDIPGIAKRCRRSLDSVDIVVNAAGVNLRQPVDEIRRDMIEISRAQPAYLHESLEVSNGQSVAREEFATTTGQ